MFLQFYRLREQPFGVTPNPRYLYHGPAHREALASLIYGIEADLGFAALIAEPGMGKTTLLYYLLERFRATARTAFVFQTQCSRIELLRYLANELEVPAEETDAVVLNDRIRQVLVEEARVGRRVIVIIDEAHNLSEDALEAVRLLSDFETPDSKLMHIILSGQPELAEKLARPSMAQLLQRIAMLNRLAPFGDAEQVSHYLAYRLQVAGYTGSPLFTPDAVELICRHSKGIPRQINRICFNALSLGCATHKRRIDGAIIREVLADLDVVTLLEAPVTGTGSSSSAGDESLPPKPLKMRGEAPSNGGLPGREPVTIGAPSDASLQPVARRILYEGRSIAPDLTSRSFTDGALALAPQSAIARNPAKRSNQQPVRVPQRPLAAVESIDTAASQNGIRQPKRPEQSTRVFRPEARPEQRTKVSFVLLCALGVPLLIFAAWVFAERQHLLPAFSQPSTIETPVDSTPATDHGTSVTLPPSPDSITPEKPKKAAPGPRSEMSQPPELPLKDRSASPTDTGEFRSAAARPHEVRPAAPMAQIVVSFDSPQAEKH